MSDIWSVVRWWDDWQLRILVLGSLGLQWFLLLTAPMRKYTIPRVFRTCIWLAYISSDALAIYALATLFNRHARGSNCGGVEQSQVLEVLWAPVLLIHLGGQQEMTGYEIEDNELWTRHTVTLVSQVAVALYAFCKSWGSSSDWKLLAVAVLLFVVGVLSFSEKPLALNRAKIKRLAAVSAWVQGTKKPSKWRKRVNQFFNCFTGMPPQSSGGGREEVAMSWLSSSHAGVGGKKEQKPPVVALTEADKVLMLLSDMSLLATAKDLVARNKAGKVEDVLPPLPVAEKALRSAFAFIYTRATVVVTPLYLLYKLLVVPILHVAALALFAASDKNPYRRADVKITYIILCLTAALDVLAVFVRQLLYRLMSMTKVPALCETVPSYNLMDAALREGDKSIGWIYKCARRMGFNCKGGCLSCRPQLGELYKKVAQTVIADLVDAQDRDLASYRILDSNNWALSEELQGHCGEEMKESLRVSFDRSVLLWHMASDLCFRCIVDDAALVDDGGKQEGEGGGAEEKDEGEGAEAAAEEEEEEEEEAEQEQGGGGGEAEIEQEQEQEEEWKRREPALRLHIECTVAISNYMAHLLNFNPEMLLTGSRHHLISEALEELKSSLSKNKHELSQKDVYELIAGILDRAAAADGHGQGDTSSTSQEVFHILEACKLAKELLGIRDPTARWMLMYRVWLGMLCYSASMCRGYLHAKSLGEGGEFLSFVWLVLSLKGAKSLADKLQMPPETSDAAKSNATVI